jgi:hypothetical protein
MTRNEKLQKKFELFPKDLQIREFPVKPAG